MTLMFIVKISSGGSVDIGQLTGPPIRYTPRHGLEYHQQVQQVAGVGHAHDLLLSLDTGLSSDQDDK